MKSEELRETLTRFGFVVTASIGKIKDSVQS